jgi:hypothetical protein
MVKVRFRQSLMMIAYSLIIITLHLTASGTVYSQSIGSNLAAMLSKSGLTALPVRVSDPNQVSVEKIEVVQVIQDMNHSVPLIAGKTALVRFYLSYEADAPITVKGTLSLRKVGGGAAEDLASDKTLSIAPALNGQTLQKRKDISQSLNFVVPATKVTEGQFTLTLSVNDATSGTSLSCPTCTPNPPFAVRFISVPPLRVRLIGLRYEKRDFATGIMESLAPNDADFDMAESWIRRAYPISQLISTRAIIPIPSSTWRPTNDRACEYVNALLTRTRQGDIKGNSVHPLTHYYGIVPDGGGFMRGCAAGQPDTPNPSITASGPTGSSAFQWDKDGVYGDWYTGHEIAHTLGRKHPGKCFGQVSEDSIPQTEFIGDVGDISIGYDVGDVRLSSQLRPILLTGPPWTDMMTYCPHQWISAYTYKEILNRMLAEANLNPSGANLVAESNLETEANPSSAIAGATPLAAGPILNPSTQGSTPERTNAGTAPGSPERQDETDRFLAIVATINITKKTGELLPPLPVSKADAETAGQDVLTLPQAKLRLKDKSDNNLGEYTFLVNLTTDREKHEDQTGMANGVIPYFPQTATIELILLESGPNGEVQQTILQTLKVDKDNPKVENLSVKSLPSGPDPAGSSFPLDITWEGKNKGDDKITYNVEMSTDGGKTWVTAAVYYEGTSIKLDPQLDPAENVTEIQIKVTANDGFNSSGVTKTFKIK